MMIAGIWEIFLGILTIVVYLPQYSKRGIDIDDLSVVEADAINSLLGSLNIFIISFGILFISVGILNIFLSRKIHDNVIEYKIPIFLIVTGILSYFAMDIIGGILCLTTGILILAKNKSIRQCQALQYRE